MERSRAPKEVEKVLHHRGTALKQMEMRLADAREDKALLKEQLEGLRSLFFHADSYIVLKKLKNLGEEDFLIHGKSLHLREGDILLVEEPTVFSRKVVDEIQKKVHVIATSARHPTILEGKFVFVDCSGLKLQDFRNFVLAEKEAFEKARKQSDILRNIVEGYKKERV